MKPDHPQKLPDDDATQAPSELIRALARLRQNEVPISPEVDTAILQSSRKHMASIRETRRHRLSAWLLWPTAAAACFLLAWLVISPEDKTSPAPIARQEDAAAIILREFSALYPNQIRAIVQSDSGIELTLADKPDVEPGEPLVLQVCELHGCEQIITFSGQSIDVAGHQVTVRAESGGSVTLDGEQFLWSSDFDESPAPGIKIESRRL